MFSAMVISPHADDAAAFCGATLAKLARQGWRLILVRVTDDSKDSAGLTVEETLRRNREELQAAARIMGIVEIVELGYPTDSLADVSLVGLRERMVYLFRKHRPYAVFSFDPFGLYEGNQDHLRTAQAVDEAFWVSGFDLHHPEHFAEGLGPFSVCERWYFGRELQHPNHAEDITGFVGKKIEAVLAHRTMLQNLLHQHRLQLETWGRKSPPLEAAIAGDPRGLVTRYLQTQAEAVGGKHDLGGDRQAEEFRLVRFGDLEDLFRESSEPIAGAPQPPRRRSLGEE